MCSPMAFCCAWARWSAQMMDGRRGLPALSTHRQPIICPEKDTAAMSCLSMPVLAISPFVVSQMDFHQSSGFCSAQLSLK